MTLVGSSGSVEMDPGYDDPLIGIEAELAETPNFKVQCTLSASITLKSS